MRILHIGLASHFTDGMAYQDNMLIEQAVKDGHIVRYIADCARYESGILVECDPGETVLECGARLTRVRFFSFGVRPLGERVRHVKHFAEMIASFRPNVIFVHSFSSVTLLQIAKYVTLHKGTVLYVDSHVDRANATDNKIAFVALHRILYKYVARRTEKVITRIFYVASTCKSFLTEVYGLDSSNMSLLPLGGYPKSDIEYDESRKRTREKLGISPGSIVVTHTGKIDQTKRMPEILRAFRSAANSNSIMLLAGSVSKDIQCELEDFLHDDRVRFLGWLSGFDLENLLCASDVYVQIGTESATAQLALSCRCATVLQPTENYTELFGEMLLYANKEDELEEVLKNLLTNERFLHDSKKKAFEVSKSILNIRLIAKKTYGNADECER